MHRFVKLFLVIAALTISHAQSATTPRIIGGQAASADYPFFVSILTKYQYGSNAYHWNPMCGASYLGGRYVVTAAHCVEDLSRDKITEIGLLIGDHSKDFSAEYCSEDENNYSCSTEAGLQSQTAGFYATGWTAFTGNENDIIKVNVKPESIFWHEDYDADALSNDIAMIVLPRKLTSSAINLPATDEFAQIAQAGEMVRVVGHGDVISDTDEDTFEQSSQLLEVDVTARTPAECLRAFSDVETDLMICAGQANEDSCQGDSGGPLFTIEQEPKLVGIVSWGPSQCGANERNSYGVYTNVYHYLDWIEKNSDLPSSTETDASPEPESPVDLPEPSVPTEEVVPTEQENNPDTSTPEINGDTEVPQQTPTNTNGDDTTEYTQHGQTTKSIGVGSMNVLWLLALMALFYNRRRTL